MRALVNFFMTLIGAAMAVRRAELQKIGGFSDRLGRVGTVPAGCEETELSIRITADMLELKCNPDMPAKGVVDETSAPWHEFKTISFSDV